MAALTFTDSHCHLDFEELSHHQDELLAQCSMQGIMRVFVPAIGKDNWQKILTLASQPLINNVKIYPCLGFHPWYLNDLTNDDLDLLATVIEQHKDKIVAVGETGIDGKIALELNNLKQQSEFFEQQITLANRYQLPVIVHHRRSHPQVLQILKATPAKNAGIIHAFSGSYQQAKNYIDLGFKLGIGGSISYERAAKTRKTVSKLPLSSIVLETDAPAMPLAGFQGQPNSPLKLIKVFELLCQLRSEAPTDIAQTIENNINQLFEI